MVPATSSTTATGEIRLAVCARRLEDPRRSGGVRFVDRQPAVAPERRSFVSWFNHEIAS
jgi:hypothetical protein